MQLRNLLFLSFMTATAFSPAVLAQTSFQDAIDYTDTRETSIRDDMAIADTQTLNDAYDYTEARDVQTLLSANAHTDTRESAIRGDIADGDVQTLLGANAYSDAGDAQTLTNAKAHTDARETEIRTDMATADARTLTDAKAHADARVDNLSGYVDRRVTDLEYQLDKLDRRLDTVGALNAAMAQMSAAAAATNGRVRIGTGAGFYRNKAAIAVGGQVNVGARGTLTLGASFSDNERMGGVGFGVGF